MTKLTEASIKKFLSLGGKSEAEVDETLQVVNLKITEGKVHGDIYSATLSDSVLKFDKFFIPKKLGGEIKEGDLIRIMVIHKNIAKGKIYFKILRYEVKGNSKEIIGNPKSVDEEMLSKLEATNENNQSKAYSTYTKPVSLVNPKEKEKATVNEEAATRRITSERVLPTKSSHMMLSTLTTFTKDVYVLVRCVKKTEKKSFKTSKGSEGCVFNFLVMDMEKTQMQVNCFNKTADRLNELIEDGGVYEIIGGYIKINDHKFNQTKTDYQIVLNEDSTVIPVIDNGEIPEVESELTNLSELNNLKNHSVIDFIGIVITIGEKTSIKTKYGENNIRKLLIADDSGFKVDFTLWKHHTDISLSVGDIIYVKKAKVGEYSGKNLSASDESKISINPSNPQFNSKIEKMKELLQGHVDETSGEPSHNQPEHNFKALESNKEYKKREEFKLSPLSEAYNNEDKTHKVKVYVTQFNNSEKNIYLGCPSCKKKLTKTESEDKAICPQCKNEITEQQYFFTISVRVKDYSSDQWVDHFGPVAEKILQISANEYKAALDENNKDLLNKICENVEFHCFILTVKARTTVYSNISKKKLNCLHVEKVTIGNEAQRMIKVLEHLNNE